ncbi:homoserine O-acetyltransferase MetA [Xenorhabdus budapestensis]|uniref:Homoserine O-succinyltransferase n=1 Tax=Xenorhabdus budapestensis TaxID=290110 RepID=A0A2D0J0A9_XENBU|nr:homoserine O-succinyltransferase [Xenorhabdus budapestensis]PHM27640.1 homoserine O-succinyltransferase [Xenorhabdus budapestensis]
MPIRVPDELPAVNFLRNENIFVMTSTRANIQDIRPLKVLLLNLMPKKIETENQFIRLLSNSPLQIDIQLLRINNHQCKNTPAEHLDNFYCDFESIRDQNFDGLIVTGAPLGLVKFEDVTYWQEIEKIINWAKCHVTSTLFVCWAVQAALNILYNLPKYTRTIKLSGVYSHTILDPFALLTRGFDESFWAPHSRFADFPESAIREHTDLDILASSEEAGVYLFASKDKRLVFVTGHPEYDVGTLAAEYQRDQIAGLAPVLPANYFPNNDPENKPVATWRSHGHLLFSNWLNYYVYQITPYDLSIKDLILMNSDN